MGGFPRDTGVKVDPKIEAFTNYRDNMHKNFRMNGPTIFKSLIFAVVIPAFLYLKIKQGSLRYLGDSEDPHRKMLNMFSIFPKRRVDVDEL